MMVLSYKLNKEHEIQSHEYASHLHTVYTHKT